MQSQAMSCQPEFLDLEEDLDSGPIYAYNSKTSVDYPIRVSALEILMVLRLPTTALSLFTSLAALDICISCLDK